MMRHVFRAWHPVSKLASLAARSPFNTSGAQAKKAEVLLFPSSHRHESLRLLGLAASACAGCAWILLVDSKVNPTGVQKSPQWARALTLALAEPPLAPLDILSVSEPLQEGSPALGDATPPAIPKPSPEPGATPSSGASTLGAHLGACGEPVEMDVASLRAYQGNWLVSFRSPGSMERFFDLFRVSPWVQWVAKHVPGYQIQVDERLGVLRLSILSPIPFIKLTETYRLDGKEVAGRRRDFRMGQQLGRLELREGCLRVYLRWSDPLPGRATDVFRLTSPDTMVYSSEATLDAHAEPLWTATRQQPTTKATLATQQPTTKPTLDTPADPAEPSAKEQAVSGKVGAGRVDKSISTGPGGKVAVLTATFRCLCRRDPPVPRDSNGNVLP